MRGKHVDLLVPEENRRTMGNRENSEKKGTEDTGEQREQGNRGTREQGEQGKNNICTHNLWGDKRPIGLRLSLGN